MRTRARIQTAADVKNLTSTSDHCNEFNWPPPPYRNLQVCQYMSTAAQAAAAAPSVADDNSRASFIFIYGATGANASKVNGLFAATQERGQDGRVIYAKRGFSGHSLCIEHYKDDADWQVKPVSGNRQGSCWAYVEGGCALEVCTSRIWNMLDGNVFCEQPDIRMVTGAIAETAVSCRCSCNVAPFFASWTSFLHAAVCWQLQSCVTCSTNSRVQPVSLALARSAVVSARLTACIACLALTLHHAVLRLPVSATCSRVPSNGTLVSSR